MKKFNQLLFATAVMLFTTVAFAQSSIKGKVIDAEMNSPLPGANVLEKGTTNGMTTDFEGSFTLTTQSTSGEIVISYVGYESRTIKFNGDADLGTIVLNPDNSLAEVVIVGSGVIDLAEDRKTPVAVSTIKKSEILARGVGNVEVTEIMKYSPSVFVSPGGGGFGDSALFVRGFDDTNTAVLLNGQPINSQEDGRIFWSNWQGLSDVANAIQIQRGLGSSKLAISSVGGTVNIVTKAADKQRGGSVRFLAGNDSYFKTTAEYNTGVNDKGWAFSFLVDHWQAHRSWAEGTFGQGQNYFFSVGYKPNEKHNFNFLLTGAPQFHGQRWSQRESTIEDDPKFNQHWGYTSGEENGRYTSDIESERRNYYHKPVMNLNWDWTISEKSSLSSVLYASWGRGGGTGPRGEGRLRTPDGQIDYFAIEQQNFGDPDGIGNSGDYLILPGDDDVLGTDDDEDGNYIRRASVNNHSWYGLVTNFNTELNENLNFNVGADLRLYRGDHFRQVVDFYGLEGWANDRPDGAVVTETFEADPWAALFDFADEDQRIDYDYSENINYQGVFSQIEYATDKFSAFFQGAVSNQSFEREGRFQTDENGNQVTRNSDKINKIGYNIKGGTSYAINEANKFFVNAGYYSRQPFLDNIFNDIRTSNDFVNPEVDNEDITGVEAGYEFKIGDNFSAIVNVYYTKWENRVIQEDDGVNTNGTPNDPSDDFNTRTFQRGVNQTHRGVEFDFMYRPTHWLRLNGFISAGSWKYDGESSFDEFDDDTGELINSETGVNRDGVSVPGLAQTTMGLTARANITSGLSLDGGVKYFGNNYRNEPFAALTTRNTGKIDPFALADLGFTYNFNIGKERLTLRGNVFNVLDNVVVSNSDRFGFFNTDGRTYNVSLRYNF
ncbi:TonB-dependent receptor [Winogradskyella luteola]|uniref:Carboxypeptidase-like regulatory domain-containing protein n=1 Tax=Winogradskyella luteola TaxID=2828330 RepID=A0A9X1JMV1_9FLAO|nr:carboxypeptidase-like regulatory domain-containing protein [Winogradskyella luteola]MBV7268855.1 carboxypeptidase-like regulatory domain-containing protein [Winogradskyella luteola]